MPSSKNSLERAASSYLRSAMHQPIQWHEWGEEAFAVAAKEDKPILLDIGAVWCHWCHVMDRESYEDPALAEVINENFVAVKVDRDERPDVDARYQAAVQAISGQGGWPLTAFLTSDGRPFFGGTYFPPDDRYGRPGFQRVLLTMADAWKKRRDEALESAASVHRGHRAQRDLLRPLRVSSPSASSTNSCCSAVSQFDPRHGGFGSQPKFPHPAALDLLIDIAGRTGSEEAKNAATVTLTKMSQGGVYDHLAGGFHRYSVDERWVVPHFEKMLYDNAGLLDNYVHAFQTFVDPALRPRRPRHHALDGRVAHRPRARRLLRLPGCRHLRSTTTAITSPGRATKQPTYSPPRSSASPNSTTTSASSATCTTIRKRTCSTTVIRSPRSPVAPSAISRMSSAICAPPRRSSTPRA